MHKEWVMEYERMIEDIRYTKSDIAGYIHKYIPEKLFRYRKFDQNEYGKMDLYDGKTFLSKVSDFNDPFDSLVRINVKIAEKHPKIVELAYNNGGYLYKDNAMNEFRVSFDEIATSIGRDMQQIIRVACFTERNDSILMWSHYADCHQGFCIEYDTKKLNPVISNNLFPIIYKNERMDITNNLYDNNPTTELRTILYKALDWKYEKEWRYSVVKETRFIHMKKAISAVYLGVNIDKNNYQEIHNWAKANNVKLFKGIISTKNYAIDYEEV